MDDEEGLNYRELIGKTITTIYNGDDELIFEFSNGDILQMHHYQDCCESVYIESITGELKDLIGSPILKSERSSNYTDDNTELWTFYKFATIKGYIDIRWVGTQDAGFYSLEVDSKWYLADEAKKYKDTLLNQGFKIINS